MEDLNKAKERLSKLTDVNCYLPPATVVASHFIGKDPEEHSSQPLDEFVRNSGLCKEKLDLRHYGFNHPNPSQENTLRV